MIAQDVSRFRILQVNLQSDRGGDGRIVSGLHEQYADLGYQADLLIGRGTVTAGSENLLPNDKYRSRWARYWLALGQRNPEHGAPTSTFAKLASWIGEPGRRFRVRNGFEDFDFPATLPVITQRIREGPTILHLHNLHGGFFDLRALPALSELTPVVLTLHDQWIITGHCAQSFECERWRIGCGDCPDLTIYPAIPKDRTAENFVKKRQIFSQTRLYVAAPSKWLIDKAKRSLLAPAIEEARMIPNGVNPAIFRPGEKAMDRFRLRLPRDTPIVLSAGTIARADHWTDRNLIRSTVRYLANQRLVDFTLVLVGSERTSQEVIDGVQVIHRPYERNRSKMASYYRAADVYLHPARADTFSMAALESLACGVPVVATDVGGIPEVVKSLWASKHATASPASLATGILADAANPTGLGKAVELLLLHEDVRSRLGENGSAMAVSDFTITRQAQRYLDWYHEIFERRPSASSAGQGTQAPRRGQRL